MILPALTVARVFRPVAHSLSDVDSKAVEARLVAPPLDQADQTEVLCIRTSDRLPARGLDIWHFLLLVLLGGAHWKEVLVALS